MCDYKQDFFIAMFVSLSGVGSKRGGSEIAMIKQLLTWMLKFFFLQVMKDS